MIPFNGPNISMWLAAIPAIAAIPFPGIYDYAEVKIDAGIQTSGLIISTLS